jgi:small GTP-binding protein
VTQRRAKVCMLGGFAVGKTSLVKRFVTSLFSERYQTTIGVQIDKKELVVDGCALTIVLWDLYGEDEFQRLHASFLRGADGLLFVVDGTRAATLETALELARRFEPVVGAAPRLLLVNKDDLSAQWELREPDLARLAKQGWRILRTSAKTGAGVEQAFEELGRSILGRASD